MAEQARLSRRGLARRLTVQALYQWLVNESPPPQLLREFSEDGAVGRADAEYFAELLNGAVEQAETLCAAFEPYLDRPLDQLDPVERAILMLASYELKFRPEVPWKVVVNEAVNLGKLFGAADSYRYINGVLDKLAHEVRAADIAAGL